MKGVINNAIMDVGLFLGIPYFKNALKTKKDLVDKYRDIYFSGIQTRFDAETRTVRVDIEHTCKFLNFFIDEMVQKGAYFDPVVFEKERVYFKTKFKERLFRFYPYGFDQFNRNSVRWLEIYYSAPFFVKDGLREEFKNVYELRKKNDHYYLNRAELGKGVVMINEDFDDPEKKTGQQVLARALQFFKDNWGDKIYCSPDGDSVEIPKHGSKLVWERYMARKRSLDFDGDERY